jgi:hypothetical protein
MDDPNNTTDNLDQADEEILTYTASDEALEAAAGTEDEDRGVRLSIFSLKYPTVPCGC